MVGCALADVDESAYPPLVPIELPASLRLHTLPKCPCAKNWIEGFQQSLYVPDAIFHGTILCLNSSVWVDR
jgi:hypothetical protein